MLGGQVARHFKQGCGVEDLARAESPAPLQDATMKCALWCQGPCAMHVCHAGLALPRSRAPLPLRSTTATQQQGEAAAAHCLANMLAWPVLLPWTSRIQPPQLLQLPLHLNKTPTQSQAVHLGSRPGPPALLPTCKSCPPRRAMHPSAATEGKQISS